MTTAHILFSGKVQGVGFRFTAQSIAASLELKGWVKNLRDGKVEVLAQGRKEAIEKLCSQLKGHFGSYIHNQEIDFQESNEQYKDFIIVY